MIERSATGRYRKKQFTPANNASIFAASPGAANMPPMTLSPVPMLNSSPSVLSSMLRGRPAVGDERDGRRDTWGHYASSRSETRAEPLTMAHSYRYDP